MALSPAETWYIHNVGPFGTVLLELPFIFAGVGFSRTCSVSSRACVTNGATLAVSAVAPGVAARGAQRQYVALKVQKSADHYTEAARDEIDLLQTVRANAEALKELADKDPT